MKPTNQHETVTYSLKPPDVTSSPHIEYPELPQPPIAPEFASITPFQIQRMSLSDLQKLLLDGKTSDGMSLAGSTVLAISTEIARRATEKAAKPHWLAYWTLAVCVVSAFLSAVPTLPVIEKWVARATDPVQRSGAQLQEAESQLKPVVDTTQQSTPVGADRKSSSPTPTPRSTAESRSR